jgi:hypothetical protein
MSALDDLGSRTKGNPDEGPAQNGLALMRWATQPCCDSRECWLGCGRLMIMLSAILHPGEVDDSGHSQETQTAVASVHDPRTDSRTDSTISSIRFGRRAIP